MSMLPLGILLAALLQGAPAPPPPALLGQWESAVRNKGGIGNILEFQPDGRVTQISAAMSDTTYELQGEWLRTFYTDDATGQVRESDLMVEFQGGDRFTEKSADGEAQGPSDRVGAPEVAGASPLVGQWCSLFLDMLTNYRQFTAGGKVFVRMPILTLRGTYRVEGGDLTVAIFGQPPNRYPFRIENGQLFIQGRGGSDRVYKRAESTLLRGY